MGGAGADSPCWKPRSSSPAGVQSALGNADLGSRSNPLFPLLPWPAEHAGHAPLGSAATGELDPAAQSSGGSCWRSNKLFCSPPRLQVQSMRAHLHGKGQQSASGAEGTGICLRACHLTTSTQCLPC